jgi:hypothetical protein
VAREMVIDALARYGRQTPNASESLPSGCTPTGTTALTPALGGQLAAGPREGVKLFVLSPSASPERV